MHNLSIIKKKIKKSSYKHPLPWLVLTDDTMITTRLLIYLIQHYIQIKINKIKIQCVNNNLKISLTFIIAVIREIRVVYSLGTG